MIFLCRIFADEESVPLSDESVNLIVSASSAHWINDLPGFLSRCNRALRPDGALILSMLGGNTLYELRCSLQLAENERRGGVAQHISPFVQVRFARCFSRFQTYFKPQHQDVGALLGRAGFAMVTLDSDALVVNYPHIFALMHDLQGMGEQACT